FGEPAGTTREEDVMGQKTTWIVATIALGSFFACELQPDWSDVAEEIQRRKETTGGMGGSDLTTTGNTMSGSGGTDMTGSMTTSGPGVTTSGGGAAGAGDATGGAAGTPIGMGGMGGTTGMGGSGGGAGTTVVQDAGKPDAIVDKRAMGLIELKEA